MCTELTKWYSLSFDCTLVDVQLDASVEIDDPFDDWFHISNLDLAFAFSLGKRVPARNNRPTLPGSLMLMLHLLTCTSSKYVFVDFIGILYFKFGF
jgi:hypothetical protein